MIRINQLKLNIAHTQSDLERKILKTLHMKKEYLQGYKIRRQSIDARKKPDLYYVYSVDVLVKDEAKIKKSIKSNQIQFQAKEDAYNFPANGTREFKHRPVIIGTGPAGLFCGYMLAIHGYRPILLLKSKKSCVLPAQKTDMGMPLNLPSLQILFLLTDLKY